MQDNHSKYNDNVDEAFLDFAWSEMRQLLDEEMPVAAVPPPASRRRYWWLLLLLFLMTGIGIGLLVANVYFPSESVNEPIPNPAIADVETSKNRDDIKDISKVEKETVAISPITDNQTANNEVSSKNPSFSKTEKTSADSPQRLENEFANSAADIELNASKLEPSSIEKSAKVGTDNKNNPNTNFPNNQIATPTNQLTEAKNSNSSTSAPKTIVENKDTEKSDSTPQLSKNNPSELLIEENTNLDKTFAAVSWLSNPLKTIDYQRTVVPIQASSLVQTEPARLASKQKSFLIQTGLQTRRLGSLDGWYLGIGLERTLKNPKWALQTGLIYENIKTQGNPLILGASQTDREVPLTVVDTLYNGNLPGSEASNIPLNYNYELLSFNQYKKLHYVTLPLALSYRLNPKIQLQAGIKMSALLGTSFSPQSLAATQNLDRNEVFDGFKSTGQPENATLRRWDLRSSFGMTWYPTGKNWGFDVQYNAGWVRPFPNLNTEAFSTPKNSSLQLGLRVKL